MIMVQTKTLCFQRPSSVCMPVSHFTFCCSYDHKRLQILRNAIVAGICPHEHATPWVLFGCLKTFQLRKKHLLSELKNAKAKKECWNTSKIFFGLVSHSRFLVARMSHPSFPSLGGTQLCCRAEGKQHSSYLCVCCKRCFPHHLSPLTLMFLFSPSRYLLCC